MKRSEIESGRFFTILLKKNPYVRCVLRAFNLFLNRGIFYEKKIWIGGVRGCCRFLGLW